MSAYYNENDPKAAAWLRELIREGHIARGEVDDRSIKEVHPSDLKGFTQCHFFAGIGGWSYALRLAGWSDSRPVWTGSCPCQPFSQAGRQTGFADRRHLWPVWFRLIRKCHPDVIFGEQVTAAIKPGWLDLVSTDLETENYACGSGVLGAHSVGAPHIRQRLYWVADHRSEGRRQVSQESAGGRGRGRAEGMEQRPVHSGSVSVADRSCTGLEVRRQQQARRQRTAAERGGKTCALDHPRQERQQQQQCDRPTVTRAKPSCGSDAGGSGRWTDCAWVFCRDGKSRPVEPGAFPLVDGLCGRVGLLRGYGNAIVPQVAAEFIEAYRQTRTRKLR